MKNLNILYLFAAILFLTSCFKEDERVIPYVPGGVETRVITMEEDYSLMSFFDLSTGKVVDSGFKNTWDLAISTNEDNYSLFLNTSIFMKVAHTEAFNFDSVYTTGNNTEWKFDSSDGDSTGNAIGYWWLNSDSSLRLNGEVLLIDRGIDNEGMPLGYLKIQPVLRAEDETVEIRISNINNTDVRAYTFTRTSTGTWQTLSFENGINEPQPFPEKWNLWFTQYTTLLYTDEGEAYPYLVTGVLINRENTTVALDTVHPFTEISRELAEFSTFSNKFDVIGYDWKKINGDVTSGDVTYTTRSNYTYILSTQEGFFYKLRFVDFYNKEGIKGYPKFEFQRL